MQIQPVLPSPIRFQQQPFRAVPQFGGQIFSDKTEMYGYSKTAEFPARNFPDDYGLGDFTHEQVWGVRYRFKSPEALLEFIALMEDMAQDDERLGRMVTDGQLGQDVLLYPRDCAPMKDGEPRPRLFVSMRFPKDSGINPFLTDRKQMYAGLLKRQPDSLLLTVACKDDGSIPPWAHNWLMDMMDLIHRVADRGGREKLLDSALFVDYIDWLEVENPRVDETGHYNGALFKQRFQQWLSAWLQGAPQRYAKD